MKLFFFLAALVVSVLSQSIQIMSPTNGASVTSGQNTTLSLAFPNSLTGVEHVSVVISMFDCAGQACPTGAESAQSSLGKPLFMGGYDPQYHEASLPPYPNFTVTIPDGTSTGTDMLTVAHFMLLGASAEPILEFKNVTVDSTAPQDESRRSLGGRIMIV